LLHVQLVILSIDLGDQLPLLHHTPKIDRDTAQAAGDLDADGGLIVGSQ
jgi:hypothetical protein